VIQSSTVLLSNYCSASCANTGSGTDPCQIFLNHQRGIYVAKVKFNTGCIRMCYAPHAVRRSPVAPGLFSEGMNGAFSKGGLAARELYFSITGTSRATATRDLQNFMEKGVH